MGLERYFASHGTGTLCLERPEGLEHTAWSAIDDPLQRLNRALATDDLPLVIGTCKDIVEATAKVVLAARGETTASNEDFPKLLTKAQSVLDRQPGRGLAADPHIRDVAQGALKVVNSLPALRNRYGTGHGRAQAPEVAEEIVLVTVDMAMLWTRWALRRLRHVILGRPENLISYLSSGGRFTRGHLSDRLRAARLADLDPADQSALGVAVAHRAMTGTFLVMDEGVERCAESDDVVEWPEAYRTGLINGLLLDAKGQSDTSVWAVQQIAQLLRSISDPGGVLGGAAEKLDHAWASSRLDTDETREEVRAAMAAERPRVPAAARAAWDRIRDRVEVPF